MTFSIGSLSLFSSVAQKTAFGSFIDIFQSAVLAARAKLIFDVFQSKKKIKLKTQYIPPFICSCMKI